MCAAWLQLGVPEGRGPHAAAAAWSFAPASCPRAESEAVPPAQWFLRCCMLVSVCLVNSLQPQAIGGGGGGTLWGRSCGPCGSSLLAAATVRGFPLNPPLFWASVFAPAKLVLRVLEPEFLYTGPSPPRNLAHTSYAKRLNPHSDPLRWGPCNNLILQMRELNAERGNTHSRSHPWQGEDLNPGSPQHKGPGHF